MRRLSARTIYLWIGAMLLAALVLSGGACAEQVEFWVGDSSGTPVTEVNVPINGEVDLAVWMTSDYQTKAMELLFGYDTAISKGTSAVKQDNKIGLVSVTYGTVASAMTARHAYNWYGGDYKSSESERRPGGYRLALDLPVAPPTALGPYTAANKVFDIKLKNLGVAAGEHYYVGLWNARPAATGGSSFCTKARMTTRVQDLDLGDSCNPAYGAGTGWSVKITNTGGTPITIDGAKRASEGLGVTLSDATVTATFSGATGAVGFAVEEQDRSAGIRIVSTTSVSVGDKVKVTGTISTVSGERVIDASSGSVTVVSSSNPVPKPVGIPNAKTGGGTYGAQEAVVNVAPATMSSGRNSVGLLMRIWGKVTASSGAGGYDGYFYVDDGSNLQDGSGNVGIRCRPAPGVSIPAKDQFVSVTGVMGVRQISGVNARYFWTVSWH